MRRIALVCLGALVVAGCGSGKTSSSATAKQTTIAEVCTAHPEDIGHIAAGLVAFKLAMDDQNTSLITPGVTEQVTSGVSDLKSAAAGATSSNPEATSHFLELLEDLQKSMNSPPTYPTAYVGDKDVTEIEEAGKQVSCTV